jgi:hypothetical protein
MPNNAAAAAAAAVDSLLLQIALHVQLQHMFVQRS